MSEIFLFYKPTIPFGWNMFYLQVLYTIGSIGSKKSVLLKGVIQVEFYFSEILMKIQTKEEWLNFLKT